MAGGLPNLLPLAVVTAASAVAAIVGARLQRKGIAILVSAALAFAGAIWHVNAQEVGTWLPREAVILAELIVAALPPLLVGLLVLLPSRLGWWARSAVTFAVAVLLIAGSLAVLQVVEAVL